MNNDVANRCAEIADQIYSLMGEKSAQMISVAIRREFQTKPCGHNHHFGYGTYTCELPEGHEGQHKQRGCLWTHTFAHDPR